MKKTIALLVATLTFFWGYAQNSVPNDVALVISQSGKNGEKLKQVIRHYQKSNDRRKLDATYFLIKNLKGHYSQELIWIDCDGKDLKFNELKYPDMESSVKAFNQIKRTNHIQDKIVEYQDIDVISTDYIIKNIDQAFELWKKPWNAQLSFEDFCEFLLPYRISLEAFQDWRSVYFNYFKNQYNNIKNEGKKNELCILVNNQINSQFTDIPETERAKKQMPLLGPLNILHRLQGDCPDRVNFATYAMRSVGVPCCTDFTPFWATSSGTHFWNVTLEEGKKPIIFMSGSHSPGTYIIERELGKVFRITYAEQKESLAKRAKPSEIPEGFLQTPFIKDVTNEYVLTGDYASKIRSADFSTGYTWGFAAVFNYSKWKIIDWGEVKNKNNEKYIQFRNLGVNCIYLPVFFQNGKTIPAGEPFSIDMAGNILERKPDINKTQTIKLNEQDKYLIYRPGKKYKLFYWDKKWIELGEKTAGTQKYLVFENVPANAVLLLRPEYSQGKERIFTVNNKGQRTYW